jgi:hypothetical protein
MSGIPQKKARVAVKELARFWEADIFGHVLPFAMSGR